MIRHRSKLPSGLPSVGRHALGRAFINAEEFSADAALQWAECEFAADQWKPGSMVSRLIPGLLDVAQDHAKSAKRLLGAVNQDHILPRAFLATHPNLLRKELRVTHCFRVAAMIQFESAAKG